MGVVENFSQECLERCPELQSCAAEAALRRAEDGLIGLDKVIERHQQNGTLPMKCEDGPTFQGTNMLSSRARNFSEVAVATSVKIDAWGDLVVISCRSQARVGGGNIKPID